MLLIRAKGALIVDRIFLLFYTTAVYWHLHIQALKSFSVPSINMYPINLKLFLAGRSVQGAVTAD